MKTNKRMTPHTLLLIMFTTSILCGCNTPTEKNKTKPLTFKVDTTLLAPAVYDTTLKITMAAPKNWQQINASLLTHANQQTLLTDNIKMTAHRIFLNKTSGAMCVLSKLDSTNIPSDNNLLHALKTAYQQRFTNAHVTHTTFTKDTFHVKQLMVNTMDFVLIKLICNSTQTPNFGIDYWIPKSVYKTELRAIESSIGSIKPMKK